jgi:hypothetical protein
MTTDRRGSLWKTLAIGVLLLAAAGCASREPAPGSAGRPGGTVLVGASRVEITPEEPIRLTGYMDRQTPADSVAQRLWVKALAFGSDGEGPAVLITADVIGVPLEVTREVARRLESAGIRPEQLVVAATHTHTGPGLSGVLPNPLGDPTPPEQQAVIDRYTAQLVSALERAARLALADRRPALLSWSSGTAGFAVNRRVLRDGRWTGFGVVPDGPVDHELPMLTVMDPAGGLRAVLVNYAAHATTLVGRDNFVHGDWPGAAKEMIEERHPGALALVTIGAGADANPEPRGSGIPDVLSNARQIADEVDHLLNTPLRPISAAPTGRLRLLQLPFEPLPQRSELERRAQLDDVDAQFARAALQRLQRGETLPTSVTYPVQTWKFGDDLAMVFLGGEVVVDFGLRLKRELDASRLWVTAYANDVAFYVPSRRILAEGGYEVDRSMIYYGQPSRLAPATEDLIVGAVHELLRDR